MKINKKKSLYVAVLVNPEKKILEDIKDFPFDYYQLYNCELDQIEFIKKKYSKKIITAITVDTPEDVKNTKLVIIASARQIDQKERFCGKKVYETLLTLVLNPEYGDITDPEAGTDLDLGYGKPAGAAFPQTSLTPKRKTSTMCIDLTSEECDQILEKVPDFDKLFEAKSSEEVRSMLDQHLSSDTTAEEASSETRVTGEQQKSSVDAAFDDLLSA